MFPTEQQIYHRLRWDPRFDIRRCRIVISLRPTGTQQMGFIEFDADAIPWHRIVEFWVDDELAWSRPQRIDRLDDLARRAEACAGDADVQQVIGGAPTRGAAARGVPTGGAPTGGAPTGGARSGGAAARGAAAIEGTAPIPLVPQRFDGARWVADASTGAAVGLRVVVWNLLFDRHRLEGDDDGPRRWCTALDELSRLDADVIALVEVTAAMRTLILEQPWVRAAYATSHGPDAPIPRYGQLLLARGGIAAAGELELVRDKRAVIAELGGGLGACVVHLTSNRKADAVQVRAAQLDAVLDHLHRDPRAWILCGDFNADPEEHAAVLGGDCWSSLHPTDPGFTFDVERNPLAARASRRGRSARYDRIHLVGSSGFGTVSCDLVGTTYGDAPPSDHFGVVAELATADVARGVRGIAAERATTDVAHGVHNIAAERATTDVAHGVRGIAAESATAGVARELRRAPASPRTAL
ncbi:MAG: DUF504 domain-containing protein, partial [Deltaproteobacteria bacterium]|nr:DUF504 domain-containing protein [Deltaproteobacteria bacterium]